MTPRRNSSCNRVDKVDKFTPFSRHSGVTRPATNPARNGGVFHWPGPMAKPDKQEAKPAPKSAPVKTETVGGFSAFFARQIERFQKSRPDHSLDGFLEAIRLAVAYAGKRDWNTAEDMCEEIEAQMRDTLRVPGGVFVEFVARNRESKQPRLLILTEWGFREAVEGQLSFNLHFKPDRAMRPVAVK